MAKMIGLDPVPTIPLPHEGWQLMATEAGRYSSGLRATVQLWNDEIQDARQLALAHSERWASYAAELAAKAGCETPDVARAILQLAVSVEGALRQVEAQERGGGNIVAHKGASAEALLKQVRKDRLIHPAQDFMDSVLYFGLPVDDEVILVSSGRRVIRATELPAGVHLDNRGFDRCGFSHQRITEFLAGQTITTPAIVRKLEAYLKRFAIFRELGLPLLLAIWTLGTFIYRVFYTFPYLVLRSPQKRCGKSRVEDLISQVAFNASPRMTSLTEAVIFRGPAKNGGTLLLDEVEHLGTKDAEAYQGLLALLNTGFQAGGAVSRMEKRGDRFIEVSYPTYAPRVLAGISKLAETLEDRSIIATMHRKRKDERTERFSPKRLEPETQALRDDCYVWALTHAVDVSEVYEAGHFPDLNDLDDRAQDLWEPLMTIASLADREAKDAAETADFASRLKALALELCQVRDEGETTTVKLIEALLAILQENDKMEWDIEPSPLLPLVQAKGFDWVKSPKKVAELMNGLGIYKQGITVPGKKKPKGYRLSTEKLEDLKARYGPQEESETRGK
jgi:Protein of unknown function (DUF3631)